ncbi:MAG TPA: hypothetical protein VFW66_11830 [Gemmatimonadales bacterium]|nr:hypothetical protein [Gemmatimonadales bacterium]
MSREEFAAAFKGSPMKRAKLRGLKRNAAVVLGNIGDERDADAQRQALDDPEPLVCEHAEWAVSRFGAGRLQRNVRAVDSTLAHAQSAGIERVGGQPPVSARNRRV